MHTTDDAQSRPSLEPASNAAGRAGDGRLVLPCWCCRRMCLRECERALVSAWSRKLGRVATKLRRTSAVRSALPHLHRDWARPCHICTGTGLAPATSAPGLGSPLPHLHRDWAHRCHICTRTGLAPATSAPGLGRPHSRSAAEGSNVEENRQRNHSIEIKRSSTPSRRRCM